MTNGKNECTFLWLIENYSYCWQKIGEYLISPAFTADGFEGTLWTLWLNPRGDRQEAEGYISLFLTRCSDDDGPVDFSVKYELSILAAEGLSTRGDFEFTFKKEDGCGRYKFVQIDEVLLHRKADYLPQDTLSVRCKMWRGEGNVQVVNEITARTRIGIEEISFLHLIESFSTLEPNERKTIQIKSPSRKNCALTSSLYFMDDSSEGKIMVEIKPSGKNQILAKCKLSLLRRSGKKIKCCETDNRLDATRKGIQNLPLSLTRQEILNWKSYYLPEDNLSLSCECVFSTGVEYEKIEKTLYVKPFVASSQIGNNAQSKGIYNAAQKLSACPNAMDDLKAIYNNQFLTDVELKTKKKSFPAHKIWLCARSPVFKTMLTSDMREKNSNLITIDDLEDDTVQQLLLFLYTDKLEKICWESAIKLYYAGDKYQIEKLKVICSSFLVDNVSTASASELLILADTHSDSDLKEAVEDFILKHEEQVFGSEEWDQLTEVNSQLALKTMLLKYKRKSTEVNAYKGKKTKGVPAKGNKKKYSDESGEEGEKVEEQEESKGASESEDEEEDELSACPSAMDDLKAIYNDQLLTDVELKTKTKSFPAHKIWLCARSPVFKTMLTSDMRERNSSLIPIDDLEDDTVQQLLLFLYTDKLEKICWESAIKLYYAGDKYQIEKLKVICSSLLVDNVSTTSASELLILADTHGDSDLKEAVEDFIFKHDKQVFGSEKWKKLSEVNPKLAVKTMLLKYK